MCTVTFVPSKGRILLASNRDEKHIRSDAYKPAVYPSQFGQTMYPKDGDAGGSWIAVHELGHAVVLLNGAFEPHTPEPPYQKSRGLILVDLVDSPKPTSVFIKLGLIDIEPFTAVVWEKGILWECVWDGENKHVRRKNEEMAHIWSSVTLYDNETRIRRVNWFHDWLHRNPSPGLDDILLFHQFTGDGNKHNDLLMNRNGLLYTVSITALEIGPGKGKMIYNDLKNDVIHAEEMIFKGISPPIHLT
jgi:Transport and Golgi organisation 2